MWQRFTERARKVVFYAQEEAQKFGEGYVSTEHLLLGLVRESDGRSSQILSKIGVSHEALRIEVEKQLPRGDARPSQDMTLTPRAKRVIDLAYEEAREFGHNYIGTEHLLLGLIREGDGLAGRALAKLGVELAAARQALVELDAADPKPAESSSRLDSPLRSGTSSALAMLAMRKQRMPADQVCLMFLFEKDGPAAKLVLAAGGDPMLLGSLIEEEVLAMKTPAEIQKGFLSCSELLALANTVACELGQELTAAHIILAAVVHEDNATARGVEHFGISYGTLKACLTETPDL